MFEFIVGIGVLCVLFFVGYKVTGALFKALIWLCILLPIALFLWGIAILCCCTLILIPIGMKLFSIGSRVIFA